MATIRIHKGVQMNLFFPPERLDCSCLWSAGGPKENTGLILIPTQVDGL